MRRLRIRNCKRHFFQKEVSFVHFVYNIKDKEQKIKKFHKNPLTLVR